MNFNPGQTGIQNNLFEVAVEFDNLTIDRKEIELTIGYSENKIPNHFSEMVDVILKELPGKCNIRAGYRIQESNKSPGTVDGLIIGDSFFKLDKIVTGQLKASQKIALFVCTIGNEMENWSRQMSLQDDPVMGYLIDTVASIAVESVSNFLHDHIEKEMAGDGMKITNRYSPGYCNWSVQEQHLLFSFLPENFCGVTLTESALMLPIKSVSGIIGIGPGVKRRDYICDKCGVKDCTYRSHRPSGVRS